MNREVIFESNICVNSNVFFSETDDPRCYDKFVAQVLDYDKLIQIDKRRNVDSRVKKLSEIQMDIIYRGIRCVYSKKDPCWGYDKKIGKSRCDCINGECPKIMSCNPSYTKELSEFWRMSEKDRELYGYPEEQERYYLVDMISDEEMLKYDVYPLNDGLEFDVVKNPVKKESVKTFKKVETKFDPVTGRKMYAIGYRWVITDGASYESDELVPIWGYIDEFKEEKVIKNKKAKKIRKLEKDIVYDNGTIEIESEKLLEVKHKLSGKVTEEYKLTELISEVFEDKKIAIILSNPAERGYVESMLISSEIFTYPITNIELYVASDDFNATLYDEIWISNNVMKIKTDSIYETLIRISEVKYLVKLNVSEREYFEISCETGEKLWCCRNLYGITHICLSEEYFDIKKELDDGGYKIEIINEDNEFRIKCKGEVLGNLNDNFNNVLVKLERDDYLPGEIKKIKSCKR